MKKITLLIIFFTVAVQSYGEWEEQVSGVSVRLNCVSSLTSGGSMHGGWICGNSGTVLRTTNGGTNWYNVSSNILQSINLTTICGFEATDVLKAVVTGINSNNEAVVYYTSNSGANWQITFTQPGGNIYGFTNEPSLPTVLLIGKPIGGRWSIWRSTNYGFTWDSSGRYIPQSGNEMGFNNSVYCIYNRIWFGTNNSRIYYSFYSGSIWEVQSTLPETSITSIWHRYLLTENPSIGLAYGTSMLKTTDYGSNWLPVTILGSGSITSLTGIYDREWYAIGNKIYLGHYAENWALEYTASAGSYTHMASTLVGSPCTWAVRDNGGISKYPGGVGIKPLSEKVPDRFELKQNFPNPFNPVTKIVFKILKHSFVKLVVYDVLGREVASLVDKSDGELKPGIYEVTFDVNEFKNKSEIASGIYFYSLTAFTDADIFTETRKMILEK